MQTLRNWICDGHLAWVYKGLGQQFKQGMTGFETETQGVRARKSKFCSRPARFIGQQCHGVGYIGPLPIWHRPAAAGLPFGIGQFKFMLALQVDVQKKRIAIPHKFKIILRRPTIHAAAQKKRWHLGRRCLAGDIGALGQVADGGCALGGALRGTLRSTLCKHRSIQSQEGANRRYF